LEASVIAMNKLAARALASIVVVFLAGCSNKGSEQVTAAGGQVAVSSKTEQADLKIVNWGPQNTKVGVMFNAQPDGNASFWVHANRSLEGSDAVLILNGVQLKSAISGSLITASVPSNLYGRPGEYELHIAMHSGGRSTHSDDVKFIVE
jgi:hypothetical protein